MELYRKGDLRWLIAIGSVLIASILILGTIWSGRSARTSTQEAVHSVSLFYLDELAGRREQVVAYNLRSTINNIYTAVGLMDVEELQDPAHLQAYQARMKQLFGLEMFAFVDTKGRIYTSTGVEEDTGAYRIDYNSLTEPQISVRDPSGAEKKVVIAVPLEEPVRFEEKTFTVCFVEIGMDRMLEGVSMQSDVNGSTFCNIYTSDGVALTNLVLGGLASEDNLLEALRHADMEDGFTVEQITSDFARGREGLVSFTYNGIQENLFYVPVEGVDWMLTYLIRESVIDGQISSISVGIMRRSILQLILTVAVLSGMFLILFSQMRRSSRLQLEKETADAENRARQQEMEQRLALQERLLEQERKRTQLDNMITAMASDYRSVYYVNLDTDEAECIRADGRIESARREGERFAYLAAFRDYAQRYVADNYRDAFLQFVEPASVRAGLGKEKILTIRYLVRRAGQESYEMLRMAGVRMAEDREDHTVHQVGVGFTDIDEEMHEALAKNQALSDALTAANEANRAKTAFLSNMSHEIRTPMNAIIGLDSIALNDPGLSDNTREHLRKIGSSAQHLLNIINDILDMSRIESGRMTIKNEEFSLAGLLEHVNTMVSGQCRDKGLEYKCRIIGHVDDHYIGDDMKLRQIMINILSNAVKFTPEGGEVEFTVECTARFDNRSTLRFRIRDTGIGMDRDFLPRIFDAFSQEDSSSTNKYGSTGLGMAITKNIVDLMNGKIEVESEKGKGSTFTVTVTLLDCDVQDADDDGLEIPPHEMNVLVVDDDPIACEHAKLVLGKVGINAETAASGEEAVEMVKLHHARRTPYSLVLVDWEMPQMDGIETTRRIREVTGDESAIIILTAYRWDEIQEEAAQAGVDSFIAKPLFAASVLEEFHRALKRRRASSEGPAPRADLKGRRILLAEDVQINAEIIIMLLNVRETEVEHAINGRIAVDMFAAHPAGYYDAVLMDMRMPEMDGLTAAGAIRAMEDHADAKEIPIIALTANAFDEDVQRSLQAGLNAHLSKPVEPENLYETLESLIGAREAAGKSDA